MLSGREVANCETHVEDYWKSSAPEVNPLNFLLQEEMPAVSADKAKLMELMRRRDQCKANADKENQFLDKLRDKREKRAEEEARLEEELGAKGGSARGGSSGGRYTVTAQFSEFSFRHVLTSMVYGLFTLIRIRNQNHYRVTSLLLH